MSIGFFSQKSKSNNQFINFSKRSQSNFQKLKVAKKYCALVREADEKVPMAAKKKDLSGKIQIEKKTKNTGKSRFMPKILSRPALEQLTAGRTAGKLLLTCDRGSPT